MSLHPLLCRSDSGDIAIRWPRLVWWLAVYVLVSVLFGLAFQFFVGARFHATHIAFTIIATALPSVLLLYLAKRHAEGKSARQFSLSALLASATVACVLFALIGSERHSQLENYGKREQLEQAIMKIVGNGSVHVSGTTLIQVKRLSFDDEDLQKILELKVQLDEIESPLTLLDLSGTTITDQGVRVLRGVDSLEYCFLERTGVTDMSIDAFSGLPNLKVMSVMSTRVTPQRLLTLSISHPQLNIEPKTYLKLKSQ